ncbi:MAG TPA: DUF2905 domain-containing protein [Methyloceanibacter sp.]|nr:DUF2905 domain-containing protein [Methyloceanibacter sp.]
MARHALEVIGFIVSVALLTFVSVRYGLGRLPGDIVVDRGSFYFYLPITTSILVTLLLSLVLWLIRR